MSYLCYYIFLYEIYDIFILQLTKLFTYKYKTNFLIGAILNRYCKVNISFLFSFLLFIFINTPSILFSQITCTWQGDFSSNWNNFENWDTNTVPTNADDVIIPAGILFNPILTGAVNVNNLTITTGNLNQNGQLIQVGGDWSNSGAFTENGTVEFTGGGAILYNEAFDSMTVSGGARTCGTGFTVANLLTVNGGSLTCDTGGLVNTGALTLSGGNMTVTAPATLTVTTGAFTINNGASTYTGSGTVDVSAGNLIISAGSYTGTGAVTVATGNINITGTGNYSPGAGGTTTITAGDFIASGGTMTLGDTLTLNGGDGDINISGTADVTLGAAATNGGTGGVTVSNGILTVNALLTINEQLTVNGGTLEGTGDIDAGGDVVLSAGTFDGDGRTINASADWDDSASIFNEGAGTVIFDGSGTLLSNETFNNLTVAAGSSLDVNGNILTVNGIFNIQNTGILYRTGVAGESAPTDTNSGTIAYRGAAGGTVDNYGVTDYWNLEIQGGGSFTLGGVINVSRDFTISGGTHGLNNNITTGRDFIMTGGTLNANNQSITVARNFDTSAGGTFNCNTGTVTIINNTLTSQILGSNTFYNFTCITAGKTIQFEDGETTTIAPNGTFRIRGALPTGNPGVNYVILDSTGAGQWRFTKSSGAILNMQYAGVYLSYATAIITVDPDNNIFIANSCTNWFQQLGFSSYTEDNNNNGKLDRIRIECNDTTLNDDFSGLEVAFSDYDINTNKGTNGFDSGLTPYDNIFYIWIKEKPYLNTDAAPTFQVLTNTTLTNSGLPTPAYLQYDNTVHTPADNANPVIGYTLAVADKNEIFICFSEPVYQNDLTVIESSDFEFPVGTAINSRTRITTAGAGTEEALLRLNSNVTADQIYNGILLDSNQGNGPLQDAAGLPLVLNTHRVTDIGLGLMNNGIIEPLWAADQTERDPELGGIGLIQDFDGTDWIRDQSINLEAHIHDGITSNPDTLLYFDVNVPSANILNGLWLPPFDSKAYNGIVPNGNASARSIADTGTTDNLREYTFNPLDPEIQNGATIEFLFELTGINLYCAQVINPNSSTWYRNIVPWSFDIHDVIKQRSQVTILNNVINPNNSETVDLHYVITQSGMLTVQVFDLEGDIINVLYRGRQATGDYTTSWDGRNRGGRAVARGLYFIRIVGPDIDEIRKVLVVK